MLTNDGKQNEISTIKHGCYKKNFKHFTEDVSGLVSANCCSFEG